MREVSDARHYYDQEKMRMAKNGNPKIACSAPVRFAPFPGLTYLFENPGDTYVTTTNGYRQLSCNLTDERHRLYRILERAFLDHIGIIPLMERYHYCPLSARTFHVTVADLINLSNIDRVKTPFQERFQSIFKLLPESLGDPGLSTIPVIRLPGQGEGVRMAFKELALKREAGALVAALRPADRESERLLRRLEAQRQKLDHYFSDLGLGGNRSWKPHVTLGYLPLDEYYLDPIEEEIPNWEKKIREAVPEKDLDGKITAQYLANECIEFERVTLFGFADMETYFRTDRAAQAKGGLR